MTATQPTRKDIADFFRLGLLVGFCTPSEVAQWADRIVAAEASPHIAFIELCVSGSQPASTVQTLLGDVPGEATPDLAPHILLGHSYRLITSHAISAERALRLLYPLSCGESFSEDIRFTLSAYDDELSLAHQGVYRTVADVIQQFITFLADYESYAPDTSTVNA